MEKEARAALGPFVRRAVAVVGASGGCGATTLAAALGQAAGRAGLSCCAVDLQVGGGGLDVPFAIDHLPGVRWADLVGVDGPVDGSALLARLPKAGPVHILSHVRGPAPVPEAEACGAVLSGLASVVSLVVADVPRGLPAPLLSTFDTAVVVCGEGVLELSALAATAGRVCAAVQRTVVVLRGRRRSRPLNDEVGRTLGLPVVGSLQDDPRVPRRLAKGRGPAGQGLLGDLAIDLLGIALTAPERSAA